MNAGELKRLTEESIVKNEQEKNIRERELSITYQEEFSKVKHEAKVLLNIKVKGLYKSAEKRESKE